MKSRREFLKTSSVLAFTPTIPAFLPRTVAATPHSEEKILVVLQLEGGNDGINTVIPFADEGYQKNRTTLRIQEDRLLKLNDNIGLHPNMRGITELIEAGHMSIVQGVGYPNPNRSHFRSMAIWQSARIDVGENADYGWIGQSLPAHAHVTRVGPDVIYIGQNELPVAVRGRRCVSATISSRKDLQLRMQGLNVDSNVNLENADFHSFLHRKVSEAYLTADEFSGTSASQADSKIRYPPSRLATNLRFVSELIKSGAGARVYYTAQSGYDTHASQLQDHAILLNEFSTAIKAFWEDLNASGLSDRVLVMAFSEFGRRVRENGSGGTDHGTAGPVFLTGSKLKSGLIGPYPSLLDLEAGDLKHTHDFRAIYATILDQWLQVKRPKPLERIHKISLFA